MIWYNVYDIFVNHKSNWIPDLNDCEAMQPDRPYMLDNQKNINKYIDEVNKDNNLSDFEKYCATRLMSLEMAMWCKNNYIWDYRREDYFRTTNHDKTKFVWDPDKNPDGTNKNYLECLNFKYKYTAYGSIDDTMSLEDVTYLHNDDFTNYHRSGTQDYMCVSLYRFFLILKKQFGFHIRTSPFNSKAIIAYFFDDGKATLLRSEDNNVEFFDNEYNDLINKIFKACQIIQKSQ